MNSIIGRDRSFSVVLREEGRVAQAEKRVRKAFVVHCHLILNFFIVVIGRRTVLGNIDLSIFFFLHEETRELD